MVFFAYLQKILKLKEDYPAGRVQPDDGKLIWILDQPAAQNLWIHADNQYEAFQSFSIYFIFMLPKIWSALKATIMKQDFSRIIHI